VDLGGLYELTGTTIWHFHGTSDKRAYCAQKIAVSTTGAFAGEELVVYDTGTCSGKCECADATDTSTCSCTGDCTMDVLGPVEVEDGNAFSLVGPRTSRTYGRYVRHWSGPSTKNTGIHFMEIDIYGYNPNSQDHALANDFYGTCSVAFNTPESTDGPPPAPSGPQNFPISNPTDSAEEDIGTGAMYIDSSGDSCLHAVYLLFDGDSR
jgi:hypothetical protein